MDINDQEFAFGKVEVDNEVFDPKKKVVQELYRIDNCLKHNQLQWTPVKPDSIWPMVYPV